MDTGYWDAKIDFVEPEPLMFGKYFTKLLSTLQRRDAYPEIRRRMFASNAQGGDIADEIRNLDSATAVSNQTGTIL